jgi:hypothetical protein
MSSGDWFVSFSPPPPMSMLLCCCDDSDFVLEDPRLETWHCCDAEIETRNTDEQRLKGGALKENGFFFIYFFSFHPAQQT